MRLAEIRTEQSGFPFPSRLLSNKTHHLPVPSANDRFPRVAVSIFSYWMDALCMAGMQGGEEGVGGGDGYGYGFSLGGFAELNFGMLTAFTCQSATRSNSWTLKKL